MADPLNMADDLWAWVTRYPDGSVGLIGAMVPALGTHTPLITRTEAIARTIFAPIARSHGKAAGQEVWLRRYTVAEDIDREMN
jgi:hypothetical protein